MAEKNVFISYAEDDREDFDLDKIVEEIERIASLDRIFYFKNLKQGSIDEFMEENIPKSSVVVFFCGPHTKTSDGQKKEFNLVRQHNIDYFPVFFEVDHCLFEMQDKIEDELKDKKGIQWKAYNKKAQYKRLCEMIFSHIKSQEMLQDSGQKSKNLHWMEILNQKEQPLHIVDAYLQLAMNMYTSSKSALKKRRVELERTFYASIKQELFRIYGISTAEINRTMAILQSSIHLTYDNYYDTAGNIIEYIRNRFFNKYLDFIKAQISPERKIECQFLWMLKWNYENLYDSENILLSFNGNLKSEFQAMFDSKLIPAFLAKMGILRQTYNVYSIKKETKKRNKIIPFIYEILSEINLSEYSPKILDDEAVKTIIEEIDGETLEIFREMFMNNKFIYHFDNFEHIQPIPFFLGKHGQYYAICPFYLPIFKFEALRIINEKDQKLNEILIKLLEMEKELGDIPSTVEAMKELGITIRMFNSLENKLRNYRRVIDLSLIDRSMGTKIENEVSKLVQQEQVENPTLLTLLKNFDYPLEIAKAIGHYLVSLEIITEFNRV